MSAGGIRAENGWRTAIAVLLMASLLVPLVVGYSFFFPFVVPRNIFFRVSIELAATVLVLFICFQKKRVVLRGEYIFWALVAFLGAQALSAFFSPASSHSFFGDFERMGGVWAWLHLALFFLLLRTLRDGDWTKLLHLALAVSVVVSVGAIAERSGVRVFGRVLGEPGSPSASTVGNPGLLAAYLLFGLAVAAYLALAFPRFRPIYVVAAALNLVALAFADNRSTIVGLVLGGVAGSLAYGALALNPRRRRLVPSLAIAFALIVAAISAVVRSFPSSRIVAELPDGLVRLAETSPAGVDMSRTMQWRASVEGFTDRPLLGYGPENHNLAWSAHLDPRIYGSGSATDIYDRAHNQYLELLGTTGLLGALAFVGVWVAIGVALYRGHRARHITAATVAVLVATQVAYATYLFFWFFDLNSTMLWIVFAALAATLADPVTIVRPVGLQERESRVVPWVVAGVTVAVLVLLLDFQGYQPLRASRALAQIDSPRGPVAEIVQSMDVAGESGAAQTAHTPIVFGAFVTSAASRYADASFDNDQRDVIDRAFTLAISSFRSEIHRDTLNDRLYTNLARLQMAAAEFYQSGTYTSEAIAALNHAISLSPRRIQPRLLLAEAFLRKADTARARATLADAAAADPELGEPLYRLANLYLASGKTDSAATLIRKSLALGYIGSPDHYLALGKRLEFSGRAGAAAALYSDYLETKYSKSVWETSGTINKSIPAVDIAVAAHLPLLYVRARESELAIKSAAALALFDPSQSSIVDRFVSDVGARRRRGWIARNSLLSCETGRGRLSADSVSLGACAVFRRKL